MQSTEMSPVAGRILPDVSRWLIDNIASKIWLLNSIAFAIVGLGLFTDVIVGYESAVEKSGSVLVCYALLMVFVSYDVDAWVSHWGSYRDSNNDKYKEYVKWVETNEKLDWPKYRDKLKATEIYVVGDVPLFSDPEFPVFNNEPVDEKERRREFIEAYERTQTAWFEMLEIRRSLVPIEFACGIGGTLIWGFGDLI